MKVLIFLIGLSLTACASNMTNPQISQTSPSAQLENNVWEINLINNYPEMMPKDYFTAEFKSGDIVFKNTCGGFWGKYHFESDDVVWLEMWDLGQNACTELVKLPDGTTHEKLSPANHIQAALEKATGRYYISQSDEYNIELSKTHNNHVSLSALGFSRR